MAGSPASQLLERFNYFYSRKKSQKVARKGFILSLVCILVAMVFVDLLQAVS
jgi:hypothetical protein